MINIIKNQTEWEFEFSKIRIIDTTNTNKIYKDLFVESKIYIDNKHIKSEDIIYINELTKISEFINLSKKSFLMNLIIDKLDNSTLINNQLLDRLITNINNELKYDILEICEGDTNKLISLLVEIVTDKYLDQDILNIIIEKCFESSKLIILDNISWLQINKLYKFLNSHNFIILTTDFRNIIKNREMLEIITIEKESNLLDILDADKIISYLEMKISEPITNEKFNEFITKKDSLFSLRLLYLIKNM